MSNDTQIQPKGFYHLAAAGKSGIHGKSLAAMLLQTFNRILNDFKAGMHQHIDQTKYLDKLLHDVSKLTHLINEVSDPNVSIDSLAQQIVSQGQVVEGDIGELSNSVFKKELQSAFKAVMALIQNRGQFKKLTDYYRNLQKLAKLMGQLWSGKCNFTSADVAELAKIMPQLIKEQQSFKGMVNNLENKLGSASPITVMFASFYKDSQALWAKMKAFHGMSRLIKSITQDEIESNTKARILGDCHGFLWSLHISYKWSTKKGKEEFLKELWNLQGAIVDFVAEEKRKVKVNLTTYLTIARLVMTDTKNQFRADFPGVYDEFLDIQEGLNRMNVQGTSISQQTTTQFYQTMATVAALEKKISAMMNIPIQLVSNEINNITKRH